jgi:hypothetical protein
MGIDKRLERLIDSLNEDFNMMYLDPTPTKRGSAKIPCCDCRELNAVRGNTKRLSGSRSETDDTNEPYIMMRTELNKKGLCVHCNYHPFYQEVAVG